MAQQEIQLFGITKLRETFRERYVKRILADGGEGVRLSGRYLARRRGSALVRRVPNKLCARIGEREEILDTVTADRGCFSCTLGGADGRTHYIIATEWRGMDQIVEVAAVRTGQVLTVTVPAPMANPQ